MPQTWIWKSNQSGCKNIGIRKYEFMAKLSFFPIQIKNIQIKVFVAFAEDLVG